MAKEAHKVRTLFVGDIHLKSARVLPAVDRAVAMTGTDGVVFRGDVGDDWDVTAREAVAAVRMFADWVAARRAAGLDVTVLAGNHDLPYLARPRSYAAHWFRHEADGFKPRAHEGVHEALKPLDMRLAWRRGRVLATHAGVTGAWAAYAGLSDSPEGELDRRLRESPMHLFDMAGPARGGRSVPSPVWADRTELEADPWAGWTQVVGHTPVPTVTNAGSLWFCDTWTDGDGSMLLLSDDPPRRRSEVLSESGRRRESSGFSRGEDAEARSRPSGCSRDA